MFIWDMVVDNILGQFLDWMYAQVVDLLSQLFGIITAMGAEIFDLLWVQGIVLFFFKLGWALFIVGISIAFFETIIEMQSGKGSFKDLSLNLIKGLMAVNLFTVLPVELYKYCITLQTSLASGMSNLFGTPDSISVLGLSVITSLILPGAGQLLALFIVILLGYSIIKVLFDNLKRGGILLTTIAVGSLYMISIPRGYWDGFNNWIKQVIALCLTAFMQATLLTAGLLTFNSNMILGLGLVMSASEIPRIAGQFGLETSTKVNFMSSIYTAQSLYKMGSSAVNKISSFTK